MTDAEKANLALQFMERADLKGAEVDAYNVATIWLKQKIAAAEKRATSSPDSGATTKRSK